jgi:hypothetical protein
MKMYIEEKEPFFVSVFCLDKKTTPTFHHPTYLRDKSNHFDNTTEGQKTRRRIPTKQPAVLQRHSEPPLAGKRE